MIDVIFFVSLTRGVRIKGNEAEFGKKFVLSSFLVCVFPINAHYPQVPMFSHLLIKSHLKV